MVDQEGTASPKGNNDPICWTRPTECGEFACFYVDFPETEMSMSPKDITWPVKTSDASHGDLLKNYERSVSELTKYIRNMDDLMWDISGSQTWNKSMTELAEKVRRDQEHANELIQAMNEVLVRAQEVKAQESCDGHNAVDSAGERQYCSLGAIQRVFCCYGRQGGQDDKKGAFD